MQVIKVSSRGQIVIPKKLREEIGITKGTELAIERIGEDEIAMKKIDRQQVLDKLRRLRAEAEKIPYQEIVKEVRDYRDERNA